MAQYDDAFKADIVQRANDTSAYAVSHETGLNYKTVRAWQKEAERKGELKQVIRQHTKPSATVTTPQIASHTGKRVLVWPDTHCPFAHPDALAFLVAVRDKYQCDTVVNLGDEADFHGFSRWPKDPDGMGIGSELRATIDALTPFYREFPNVKVCTSNHTARPMKLMFASGLPEAFYPAYSTMLNAPDGWQWRDFWVIDGVRYFHGEGKSGQNAHVQFLKAYKQSVVHGHLHSFAAVSWEGDKFAMNAGCLIDARAYAFKYAKHLAIPVSLGCGVVIDGKQAFWVPMQTDDANRWTGKL